MLLVALISVRPEAFEDFRRYELDAARIMKRYGGALERAIFVGEMTDNPIREMHVVRFPDDEAFAAYRADAELLALAPLRDRSVISTQLWLGTDVNYDYDV